MATKKLETLLNDATKAATVYAKAYNEKSHKKSELKALKKAALAAMDKYNLELSKDTYLKWDKEGDPVKTAIRLRVIPGAQRLVFKTDEDDYMVVNVKDAEYDVNLPQMHATLGADVFSNVGCPEGKTWFNLVEKFAYIVANNIDEHIDDSPNFKYEILKASKEFDLPEGIDPLSDDGAVLMLQKVFDAILYIDNPDNEGTNLIHTTLKKDRNGRYYSQEWATIREEMTAAAGRNTVKICNTGTFTKLIADAMWACLTNGSFSAIAEAPVKVIKDKKSSKKSDK